MNETFPHAAFARIILFGSVVINVFVVSAVALSENVIAQQESQLMLNVVVDGALPRFSKGGQVNLCPLYA